MSGATGQVTDNSRALPAGSMLATVPPTPLPRKWSNMRHMTCAYWLRGHCRFSSADCQYAHVDTGAHAEKPRPPAKGYPAMAGANLTMVEQALNSRGVALLMGLTLRPQLSSSFDTWNSASLPVNSRRGPSPQSLVTSARTAAIAMSLSQAMGSLALPIHDTNVLADVGMQIQDIARLHGSVWALNLPGDVRGSWFRSFRDRLAVALAVDHNMTHQSAGQLAVLTVQALMKELKHCSEHGTGCFVCGQYRVSAAGPATTFRSATAARLHRLCLEEARHDRPADSWRR